MKKAIPSGWTPMKRWENSYFHPMAMVFLNEDENGRWTVRLMKEEATMHDEIRGFVCRNAPTFPTKESAWEYACKEMRDLETLHRNSLRYL